jgi:hypothetical protein
LADGTLVTRFGVRGLARHGRERGEEWNEIGFGPNDTVDAAGLPVDKGPGNFLTFVPNYLKNCTRGLEIIDNSRVNGVTKPVLKGNQCGTFHNLAARRLSLHSSTHSVLARIEDVEPLDSDLNPAQHEAADASMMKSCEQRPNGDRTQLTRERVKTER